jgi:hypothetical protein
MLIRSTIAQQMSGSLGGLTASHNSAGAYFRARSTPVDPNSAAQQAARTAFSLAVANWYALTPAQRVDWGTYADAIPWKNAVGDTIRLSGQAMHQGCNTLRKRAGLVMVQDAPVVLSLPTWTAATFGISQASPTVLTATFDNADDWANETGGGLVLQIGLQQPPTIQFYKAPFVFVKVVPGATPTPPTSPTTGTLPWTNPTEDNVAWVRQTCIRADGRISGSILTRVVIAA